MAKQKPETPANIWRSRFDTATSAQGELFKKFTKFYDIKNAVYNTENMAPWRSRVYIPVLSSKADDMIAKFLGLKPDWEIKPVDEVPENADQRKELDERINKLKKKLDRDYDNPLMEESMRDKLQNVLTDAAVVGTGVAKVLWRTKKEVYRAHPVLSEIDVDTEEEIVEETETGFNDIEPVNIFNFFISPAATSLQKSPWVIVREYKSFEELKLKQEEGIYKNVNRLKDTYASGTEYVDYNRSRNRALNTVDPITEDETVQFVEIYECYERDSDKIYTFANSGDDKNTWIVLRDQKNPYWHGKYPMVAFYVKKKPFNFWGESLFETSDRLQSAVNDIFNHYMDNWNLSIDGMVMQEEGSYIAEYTVEPGGELVYRGEQPKQFRFPEPDPTQLSLVMQVLEKAIEEATISPYAQGIPNDGTDKTQGTATGVIRLQEAASEKLGYMRSNFRHSLMDVGTMWLFNNQQFMDTTEVIETTENGRREFVTVTPVDLQGAYELKISDSSMEPMSKLQIKENHLQWVNHMMMLQKASMEQASITQKPEEIVELRYDKIAEEGAKVFGKKDFTEFIKAKSQASPEVQQMAAETGVQLNG